MKSIFRTDFWGVGAVLIVSLFATYLLWAFEKRQEFNRGQAAFEVVSDTAARDLRGTMRAYGLFLRGGVSFFRSSDEVTRADWRSYVSNLDLSTNYPGVQGVGYNAVLHDEAELVQFVERIRANDWPDYTIKPDGERDLYTPVLYLEPLNASNERALGFDIYSETNRRAAVDAAISTGEPRVTAKIRLVQENPEGGEDVQAGILVILPVFENNVPLGSASARLAAAQGVIVSVFRMGDLVESILDKQGIAAADLLAVSLYDAAEANPEEIMFQDMRVIDGELTNARFHTTQTFEVFGKDWTFQTVSTPEFETSVKRSWSRTIAIAGVLFSLLLTSVVYGQAARTRDSVIAARKLTESKDHIQMLMAEVNHRSKNLLSLVQAIARQTSPSDSDEFVSNFSRRLNALSASQDLLVKNEWRSIELANLVESQVAHFGNLIGDRITISGPRIELDSSAAQTIGMAVYELATNAGKYGSLSNDSGKVAIEWNVNADDTFTMQWNESGGPAVVPPTTKGFGTKVTGVVAKLSLQGEVTATYAEAGFQWLLECPKTKLSRYANGIETGNGQEGV